MQTFKLLLFSGLLLVVFGVISVADCQTPSRGKVETIYHSDIDGKDRYEANLFNGKILDGGEEIAAISGGVGVTQYSPNEAGADLQYASFVSRIAKLNNSVFLVNLANPVSQQNEFQAQLNFTDYFAVNGGYTKDSSVVRDSAFGGMLFKIPVSETIGLETRLGYMNWEGSDSMEGGSILSIKSSSIGFNVNLEQYRIGAGLSIADSVNSELLYINNTRGAYDGPEIYMANFSLKSKHPFYSNAARRARIFGVSSTSYENPILRGSTFIDAFAFSNYNRLQYLQDVGDGVSFRYRGITLPNHGDAGFADLLIFPFQLMEQPQNKLLNGIFLGPVYDFSTSGHPAGDSAKGGYSIGIKGVELFERCSLNLAYRATGGFQKSEKDSHDALLYLAYLIP